MKAYLGILAGAGLLVVFSTGFAAGNTQAASGSVPSSVAVAGTECMHLVEQCYNKAGGFLKLALKACGATLIGSEGCVAGTCAADLAVSGILGACTVGQWEKAMTWILDQPL